MTVFDVGRYHISVNGYQYDDTGAWNSISVFEFDGDKPLHNGCAIRHIYTAMTDSGIAKYFTTEQKVQGILQMKEHSRFTPKATRDFVPELIGRW